MHLDPPKPPKKAATKRKGQTTRERGGKATKGVVEKKEQVEVKGAGEGRPKGGEGKEGGGGRPGTVGAVPTGAGEGGGGGDGGGGGRQQKWVRFNARETPYNVATHLCFATEATATVRCERPQGRGEGGGNTASPPHTGRRGGHPNPNPQTDRGRREARHRVRIRGACHQVRGRPSPGHPRSLGAPIVPRTLRGRYTHHAHRVVHRARTALTFLPTLSCIFHIFSGWQGRGGLWGKHTTTEASTPSSSPMVVVAAHTPCQGRAVGRGRRGCRTLRYGRSTEEPSAPQGAQACGAVSNVSRFAVLNALVSRFGALLLGVPKPRK